MLKTIQKRTETQKSGGAAPYGYRRTENGFEPDPDEAPIRKLIYELFLVHKGKKTVARLINEKGYRTRSSAAFSGNSIDRFLRDPIAKGHHKDNYVPVRGPKKYRTLKPESEWRFKPVEPIINETTWNQVNDLLIELHQKPVAKKPTSLFGGLLYCTCGSKMHNPTGRRSYFCSSCDNSIEVKILELIFQEKLRDFKIDQNELQKSVKNTQNYFNQKSQRKILKKQKQSIETEMDKLYDLYMSGSISKQRFTDKHKPLEKHLADIESELALISESNSSSSKDTAANINNLYDAWSVLTQTAKRQLVDLIAQRIVVDPQKIQITFTISPFLRHALLATQLQICP